MRGAIASVLSMIMVAVIFIGCEPDNRGIKVAPKTGLDSKSEIGYDDNYYGGEVADESRYKAADRPDEFDLITIYFDYDKFDLTPEALDIMSVNADHLWNHPIKVVLIEGHCDERGTEEYNLALGEKRAREIREYLIKYGINSERLSIISYGESMPADFGHDEKSWAKNRRGEFTVLSK
jgi:peptidoglycan-associated lipoprotein